MIPGVLQRDGQTWRSYLCKAYPSLDTYREEQPCEPEINADVRRAMTNSNYPIC